MSKQSVVNGAAYSSDVQFPGKHGLLTRKRRLAVYPDLSDHIYNFPFDDNADEAEGRIALSGTMPSYSDLGASLNGINSYSKLDYSPNGKTITYLFDSAVASYHRHYKFLFGYGSATYGSSQYSWFINIYYNKRVALVSGSIDSTPLQYNVPFRSSLTVNHATGEYVLYTNGEFIKSGSSATYQKSTPYLQLFGFRSFSSTYAGRAYLRNFVMFERAFTEEEHLFYTGTFANEDGTFNKENHPSLGN